MEVSVITATMGRHDLLVRKLDALKDQTMDRTRFEWVVAGDGMPEAALAYLQDQAGDVRVKTAAHPEPKGPAATRNLALSLASGRTVLFSDDDCLPAPDAVEQHAAAQKRPAVWIGSLVFHADGKQTAAKVPTRPQYWNVNGANCSAPKETVDAIGGFDISLEGYGAEDIELGYRLHQAGLQIRPLPEAKADHIGPDPQRSGDTRKAFSAGQNAVQVARRHRALRVPLGVAPWMLAFKRVLWGGPWAVLAPSAVRAYERAYTCGALKAWSNDGISGAQAAEEDQR